MTEPRAPIDWEAVEREYRAGVVSVREIARKFEVSDTAIHKRAKAEGWERALASKVREAVREKLVRSDSLQAGLQPGRATDAEIVDASASLITGIITSHRRDLTQLHGLKRILAERLSQVLHGIKPDGPCLGEKESPGDLLEKLSRVTSRLIPLERQAHNLDEREPAGGRSPIDTAVRETIAGELTRLAARARTEPDTSEAGVS